jgi:hypothetical protein
MPGGSSDNSQRSATALPLWSRAAVTATATITGSPPRGRTRSVQGAAASSCSAWPRRSRKAARCSASTKLDNDFPARKRPVAPSSRLARRFAWRTMPVESVTR